MAAVAQAEQANAPVRYVILSTGIATGASPFSKLKYPMLHQFSVIGHVDEVRKMGRTSNIPQIMVSEGQGDEDGYGTTQATKLIEADNVANKEPIRIGCNLLSVKIARTRDDAINAAEVCAAMETVLAIENRNEAVTDQNEKRIWVRKPEVFNVCFLTETNTWDKTEATRIIENVRTEKIFICTKKDNDISNHCITVKQYDDAPEPYDFLVGPGESNLSIQTRGDAVAVITVLIGKVLGLAEMFYCEKGHEDITNGLRSKLRNTENMKSFLKKLQETSGRNYLPADSYKLVNQEQLFGEILQKAFPNN